MGTLRGVIHGDVTARVGGAIQVAFDDPAHADDFVRLNVLWITEYFSLEDADRRLAGDPFKVVVDGGHIISLVEAGEVIGVCALFKDGADRFELARMAVEPAARGRGLGDVLVETALAQARERGARSVYLMSNTVLETAIALYRKHGFVTVSEGPHPSYARCNIVMERVFAESSTSLPDSMRPVRPPLD